MNLEGIQIIQNFTIGIKFNHLTSRLIFKIIGHLLKPHTELAITEESKLAKAAREAGA